MNELIPSNKDASCFNNFQGSSSKAYAVAADYAKFWLATALENGYIVEECGDSSSLQSFCDVQSITCSTRVSSYTPTNIPTGEDKSMSISGEGTFVLGLPDSNKVYISDQSSKAEKTTDLEEQFGKCVAITSSGDLLAVGAPMMNNGDTTSSTGGVYIYEKDIENNVWNEIIIHLPPTSVKVNEFGKRIAFSDDEKLLAVVSNEMIFFFSNDDDDTTSETSRNLPPLQQNGVLLVNGGEFGGINGVANFDGGVAVIFDENDKIYTVYGKDDQGKIVALDVSFNEIVKSHPISLFDFF